MKRKPTIGKKVEVRRAPKGAGLGLFAAEAIEEGDYIIDYVGEIIPNAECEHHPGKYLFEIGEHFTIDGSGRDNIARYINHSCDPNAEVELEDGEINIYALEDIEPGEEVAYDYGKEYFDEFIKPIGCQCRKCLKKKQKTK
jgi:SET domain-containing protein